MAACAGTAARRGAGAYTGGMEAAMIARLKVTLDDVAPAVLRRIEVPFSITLDRLHQTIQAAMGWTNSHLYDFHVEGISWGIPDPDAGARDVLNARKTRLSDVVEDVGCRRLTYLYDFGDGWEHTVKIERVTEAESGVSYPRLTGASGRCPPEDIGGPWGYAEFLEALRDPGHERREDFAYFVESGFDPEAVDMDGLAKAVAALAKRWSRTPAKRVARPA